MPRLLVINSFGPMGSTLLAGLVEKLGFTNVPIRKLGLHQYLMGEYALDSGYMQARLRQALIDHDMPALRGGVSVLDRDNQAPKALVDLDRVKDRLAAYETSPFKTIQDLYDQGRQIYYDSVTYKDITSRRDWHIEMTVDIQRYDPSILYEKYQEHFDEVHMLHLHRDFSFWLNALSSQAFRHPELKQKIKFFPHLRYADYKQYEDSVARIPGLHVPFDHLFDTPIETLAQEIADFTNVPLPAQDWRHDSYDLYGKDVPYDIAFKKFDDNITFLPPETLNYISDLIARNKLLRFPGNVLAWLRYLAGLRRYHKNTTA